MQFEGRSIDEIAECLGLSRRTVGDWVRGKLPASFWRTVQVELPTKGLAIRCRCGVHHDFDELGATYAYLLGLYLGDGTISRHRRGVTRLRIFLDKRYPQIVDECAAAMAAVMPANKVSRRLLESNCFEVASYSRSWPCLFPQHGPGMKHLRPIYLADWQAELFERHPKPLLRGLIHSDGCRFINTGRGGWTCPRYSFSNRSDDIRGIFVGACDLLGVHTTHAPHTVYVSRKADVALLDTFIGPKR